MVFMVSQMIHLAYMFVADFAGQLQLVPEAFYGVLIFCNLRLEELYGHFLFHFFILGLIDPAHAPFSQQVEYHVSSREYGPFGYGFDRSFKSLGD
jgi:hypothetical protein